MPPVRTELPTPRAATRPVLPIGFGTGALMGGRQRDASRTLIAAALDAGITYFDTARMYGVGTAEGIVGPMLASRRDEMVLTSKAGILPPRNLLINGMLRTSARLIRLGICAVPMPAPAVPRFGQYGPGDITRSVERSLRELRSDRLDILLLHEVAPNHLAREGLVDELLGLLNSGTVGRLGLATDLSASLAILENHAALFSVVQIGSSAFDNDVARLPADPGRLIVTHSSLARGLPLAAAICQERPDACAAFRERTGFDLRDRGQTAGLLLAEARAANPAGIVLFSSGRAKNIAAAARIEPLQETISADLHALIADWQEGSTRSVMP